MPISPAKIGPTANSMIARGVGHRAEINPADPSLAADVPKPPSVATVTAGQKHARPKGSRRKPKLRRLCP
jgi:hypothetical protein